MCVDTIDMAYVNKHVVHDTYRYTFEFMVDEPEPGKPEGAVSNENPGHALGHVGRILRIGAA